MGVESQLPSANVFVDEISMLVEIPIVG